jgi:hypothetical protein
VCVKAASSLAAAGSIFGSGGGECHGLPPGTRFFHPTGWPFVFECSNARLSAAAVEEEKATGAFSHLSRVFVKKGNRPPTFETSTFQNVYQSESEQKFPKLSSKHHPPFSWPIQNRALRNLRRDSNFSSAPGADLPCLMAEEH